MHMFKLSLLFISLSYPFEVIGMPLLHASFPQYYFPFDHSVSFDALCVYISHFYSFKPLFKIGSIRHVLDSGLILSLPSKILRDCLS